MDKSQTRMIKDNKVYPGADPFNSLNFKFYVSGDRIYFNDILAKEVRRISEYYKTFNIEHINVGFLLEEGRAVYPCCLYFQKQTLEESSKLGQEEIKKGTLTLVCGHFQKEYFYAV